MKRTVSLFLIVCMLSGCGAEEPLEQAMELRNAVLAADSCSFHAAITADYGENLYSFQMDCTADALGKLSFTVTDPETLSGVTGVIAEDAASLTFDDRVLMFPSLAEGQATPVSTPWLFYNTLRCGYLSGCSKEENGYCIYIDDSYEEYPLQLEIYTDGSMTPYRAEICWNGQRILSADIRDFTIR